MGHSRISNITTMEARVNLLSKVCQKHSGDARLHKPPTGPGVEVVLLPGDPPVTVCIPHKVGSHAWGVFSRHLADLYPSRTERLRGMGWKERARLSRRAVVVRHPLERLVSAYRMLFQDWCDPDKFIRKRWRNICSERGLQRESVGGSKLENSEPGQTITNILSTVMDEFVHGQDRYISRIWYKYHPEINQDPEKMFKFSFPEFVRFLVNGSREFMDDSYVMKNKAVSYHLEEYWAECPVCHSITRPDYIIHMETFTEDLSLLLGEVGLAQHLPLFPHTHSQSGGHSSQLTDSFLAQISESQLLQLINKYRLDLELFGYM